MLEDKIDPSLDPLDQLEQIENRVMDWEAPEWAQGWLEEGRMEVLGTIRKSLYLQAGSKFDPETVERLTKHLDQVSDPELLVEIFGKIHEGATCAALLKCLKNRS